MGRERDREGSAKDPGRESNPGRPHSKRVPYHMRHGRALFIAFDHVPPVLSSFPCYWYLIAHLCLVCPGLSCDLKMIGKALRCRWSG